MPASRMPRAASPLPPLTAQLSLLATAPFTQMGAVGALLSADPGHRPGPHVLAVSPPWPLSPFSVPAPVSETDLSLDLGLLEAGSCSWAALSPLAELSPWVPNQRLCPEQLAAGPAGKDRGYSHPLPAGSPRRPVSLPIHETLPSTQVPSDTFR